MKLTDLRARFVRCDEPGHLHQVETLAEANGVMFLCPKCLTPGGVGTHMMICWSKERGAPEEATPAPGRWRLDGNSLADLTLNAEPPSTARSVQIVGGCSWHGFVTGGEVITA